jgi:hypothetical protein
MVGDFVIVEPLKSRRAGEVTVAVESTVKLEAPGGQTVV